MATPRIVRNELARGCLRLLTGAPASAAIRIAVSGPSRKGAGQAHRPEHCRAKQAHGDGHAAFPRAVPGRGHGQRASGRLAGVDGDHLAGDETAPRARPRKPATAAMSAGWPMKPAGMEAVRAGHPRWRFSLRILAGRDDVGGDAMGRELGRERLGQAPDGRVSPPRSARPRNSP